MGIFTTIKIKNGKPIFLRKHLDRLMMQSKVLLLGEVNCSFDAINKFCLDNALSDCVLKITIFKINELSQISMETRPLPEPISAVRLMTVPDTRGPLRIYKTTDRQVNEKVKKLAEEKNFDDALFTQNELIIESTTGNVFSLNEKGELITPNLDDLGLKGITRQIIMENVSVCEKPIPKDTPGPIVLVNSLRMNYATHINGKPVIDGMPLVARLMQVIQTAAKMDTVSVPASMQ